MIKGIEKLTEEQKDLMKKTNELHTKIVGMDYKEGMEIIETWLDKNNTVWAPANKTRKSPVKE